jgi:hypothetical protein
MTLQATCIKYLESDNRSVSGVQNNSSSPTVVPERVLEETTEVTTDEESEEEVDLTPSEGWVAGEVYIDSRTQRDDGYALKKSRITLVNAKLARPVDYFLFFLPLEHFNHIIMNINENARHNLESWTDLTFPEYLMWIAILSVMTVV